MGLSHSNEGKYLVHMDLDVPEVDYPHLPGEEHNPLMESSLHAQWVTMLVQSVHHSLAGSGVLVTGNTPFVPSDGGPHTAPDLMVLPGLADANVGRYEVGRDGPPPVACVEVRSPSNTDAAIARRLGRWLQAGVGEVYLIDPARETVHRAVVVDGAVDFHDANGVHSPGLGITFAHIDGRLVLCCPGGRAVRPGDDPFGWLLAEQRRADQAELRSLAATDEAAAHATKPRPHATKPRHCAHESGSSSPSCRPVSVPRSNPLAAIAVAAAVALAGCARGDGGRNDAREEFITQLVDGGLDAGQAECIAESFFETRSNDELNEFFAREELTDDERAEFAALTRVCTVPVTG